MRRDAGDIRDNIFWFDWVAEQCRQFRAQTRWQIGDRAGGVSVQWEDAASPAVEVVGVGNQRGENHTRSVVDWVRVLLAQVDLPRSHCLPQFVTWAVDYPRIEDEPLSVKTMEGHSDGRRVGFGG